MTNKDIEIALKEIEKSMRAVPEHWPHMHCGKCSKLRPHIVTGVSCEAGLHFSSEKGWKVGSLKRVGDEGWVEVQVQGGDSSFKTEVYCPDCWKNRS